MERLICILNVSGERLVLSLSSKLSFEKQGGNVDKVKAFA